MSRRFSIIRHRSDSEENIETKELTNAPGNTEEPSRSEIPPILWEFMRENWLVLLAVGAGSTACFAAIAYSQWLSWQVLLCPDWAVDCKVSTFVKLNRNNIAIVQGLTSIVYGTGLAAMAHGAKCLSESALWPLISNHKMTLDDIETYIEITRGSVASTIWSWKLMRTMRTAIILLLSAMTTLAPLSAAPLVGFVFLRVPLATPFKSEVIPGGGSGRIFVQQNPPIFVGDNQQASYVYWATHQAEEPMQDHRLWMIDRSALQLRGDFTANAVRAESNVSCRPFAVNETKTEPAEQGFAKFSTNMASHNQPWRWLNSSDHARVQLGSAVAVWVDDFTFHHPTKTSAVLVFAAMNGSIEDGYSMPLSQGWRASSVACDIEVELVNDIIKVGRGGPTGVPRVTLSSLETIYLTKKARNETGPITLNENVLLFAVAPMLVGLPVQGSQPLFNRWESNSLPNAYIAAPFSKKDHKVNWSIDFIKNFIDVSMGTVAQAAIWISQQKENKPILYSHAESLKLVPGRAFYLALPMGVILLCELGLLLLSVRMHETEKLSSMRPASVYEIVKAALTSWSLTAMELRRSGGTTTVGNQAGARSGRRSTA